MSEQAKVIVITGATRGLGRALAERFAEMGHTVLGCGRAREAVSELARSFGPPHDFAAEAKPEPPRAFGEGIFD